MKREIRPACMVEPYDVIDGPLPAGPWSPVVVLVPDLAHAIANLSAAGLKPQVVAITDDNPTDERNPW